MKVIYGIDIDNFSADEALDKIGISKLSDGELSYAFLEARDNVAISLDHDHKLKHEKVLMENASFAYATYKRFYVDKGKSIEFPESKFTPSDLKFWANHCHIDLLFYSLLKDGILRINPQRFTNGSSNVQRFSYASA